jgi:hypothetical protein
VAMFAFPPASDAATPTNCSALEDERGWSWSECGNLYRGVVLRTGDTAMVDAALYCHARRARLIDLRKTAHVKGDRIARDKGCSARYFAQPTDIEHALAAMVTDADPRL